MKIWSGSMRTPGKQLHRHLQLARVVVRLVPPDEHDQVAHDERGPERGEDHRERQGAPASQPPEHERVDGPRGESGQDGRDERGGEQLPAERERPGGRAGPGERDDDQRDVGAPREELGVREVREAHDPERERHPDGAERDDGAGEDAVGERLARSLSWGAPTWPPRNASATRGSSSSARAGPANRLRPSVST